MFEIAREEAEHLGYTDDIYDALLDQYEEGATAADVRAMFDAIRGPQVELVRQVVASGPVDDSVLYGEWDEAAQKSFTEEAVKAIGFDFSRGRQDTAPHPFCTGWSVGDVRLTTRYKPYIGSAIFGSLHEAGHGMYEQGSPVEVGPHAPRGRRQPRAAREPVAALGEHRRAQPAVLAAVPPRAPGALPRNSRARRRSRSTGSSTRSSRRSSASRPTS